MDPMPMNRVDKGKPILDVEQIKAMIDEDTSFTVIQVFCASIIHIQGSLQ